MVPRGGIEPPTLCSFRLYLSASPQDFGGQAGKRPACQSLSNYSFKMDNLPLVPRGGIEPPTLCSSGKRSTTELPRLNGGTRGLSY